MTILPSISRAERYNAQSLARPILVSLTFFVAVVAFRSIDLILPGLDNLPDTAIVSRVLGLLLVLGYLRVLQKPISSIGLHARNFDKAFLIGGLSLLIVYAVLYGIQFYLLNSAGETPRLALGAIDKETGVMGGSFFSLFFFIGQIVNAFMEETIFRGVILPHLMRRFSFWKANGLQAILFGIAHLVFPFSSWLRGQATLSDALAGAASLLVFTTIGGLVFGTLYYQTGSLWTSVLAHLIDNGMGLFIHIQTAGRLNAETDILILASIGFIGLVIVAWIIAKRSNLPALKAWGDN